jgi:hypothetical protein
MGCLPAWLIGANAGDHRAQLGLAQAEDASPLTSSSVCLLACAAIAGWAEGVGQQDRLRNRAFAVAQVPHQSAEPLL